MFCFLAQPLQRDEPKSVGVIGSKTADAAAKQLGQRETRRFCESVPYGHVDARHGDKAYALPPDQMQLVHRIPEEVEWCKLASFEHFSQIEDRRADISHRIS